MIKTLIKSPMAYLIAIVVLYTTYDYFEHIGRPDSTFEAYPRFWFFFSLSALLSFILVVLLGKRALEKLLNRKNLILEVMAIGVWLALYLSVLGPLFDKMLWPFDELYFSFRFGPFFIILIVFFILRMLVNLILGKKALYSK